jgi:hypothetical protein
LNKIVARTERPGILPGLSFTDFCQRKSGSAMIVVVAVMIVVVVVIAMVFVVPVAFMYSPTFAVVVVVGMGPVGAGVGWPLPGTRNPDVAIAVRSPVAISPDEAY